MTTPTRNITPDRPPAPVPDARTRREHEHEHERDEHVELQDLVDAESEQSFPASDPPSWTLGLH